MHMSSCTFSWPKCTKPSDRISNDVFIVKRYGNWQTAKVTAFIWALSHEKSTGGPHFSSFNWIIKKTLLSDPVKAKCAFHYTCLCLCWEDGKSMLCFHMAMNFHQWAPQMTYSMSLIAGWDYNKPKMLSFFTKYLLCIFSNINTILSTGHNASSCIRMKFHN